MAVLHALLIGINEYQDPDIPNLSGCINDIQAFQQYLQASITDPDALRLRTLEDAGATRQHIIQAIRNGFDELRDEDTILIYFSGHGCREAAPANLTRFVGPWLESMICHDAGEERPIADLEVRYLFHELGQRSRARLLFITDACHSGGMSRDQQLRPRLGPAFKQAREWAQFCFADQHTEAHAQAATTLQELLPQGRHLHLAACESRQSAFELTGYQGIFTANLLEVLQQTAGTITFDQLLRRLRYLIRRRFDQNPQLYTFEPRSNGQLLPPDNSLLRSPFLPGVHARPHALGVQYISGQWRIGLGAIHGMPPREAAQELDVRIVDRESKALLTQAQITKVMPGYAHFRPLDLMALPPRQVDNYIALVSGLYTHPLRISLAGDPAAINQLQAAVLEFQPQLTQKHILLDATPAIADYTLQVSSSQLALHEPRTGRLLVQPIDFTRPTAIGTLISYLSNIAHWHFVQRIHPAQPEPSLSTGIDWEIQYIAGYSSTDKLDAYQQIDQPIHTLHINPDELAVDDPQITSPIIELPLVAKNSDQPSGSFLRIRLQNKTAEVRYLSVLYLDQTFGIYNRDLVPEAGSVITLDPATEGASNKIYWIFGEKGVPVKLEEYVATDNWPYETLYLKLIISRTPFTLGRKFEQSPLPAPDAAVSRAASPQSGQSEHLQADTWTTKMITCRIMNPNWRQGDGETERWGDGETERQGD